MTFSKWWEQGFHDLIPIVPPGADLAPHSKLRPDDRGKVPGVKGRQGWVGLGNWNQATPSKDWATWGANVGLRTKNFPAVDIDCTDHELAGIVRAVALTVLGPAPTRSRSNSSKCTLLYRTTMPMKRARMFLVRDGENHLVEVLGDGQQFVVEGQHPSGVQWEWDAEPSALELSVVTAEQITKFFEALPGAVAPFGFEPSQNGRAVTTSGEAPVDQDNLAGDLATLTAAVAALPNVSPDRADYIRMGVAIKAALPADPKAAFKLWWGWCQRWEAPEGKAPNTLETAKTDWESIRPPFAIGAAWVLDQAREAGFQTAQDDFADLAEDEPASPGDVPPQAPSGPPTLVPDSSGAVAYSDAWMANRMILALEGSIRYCERLNGWMHWDGSRWAQEERGEVEHAAGIVARKAGHEAMKTIQAPAEARATAKWCASVQTRRNMLAYASADPRVATAMGSFDSDPWALNTPKGILDLKTGELLASDSNRLFTRCTAVAPLDMPIPKWTTFLRETARGDVALIDYLQRLSGYALTGTTEEHMLAFLWGPGGNGKGVFLNTLVRIFGSYASVAAMDTFTASRMDRHPTELAALFGARLVTSQETQEGRSWDEARVKSITGGDPITARYMRENFFTYTPQFKLLFAGNHRPRIQNLDDAMRRRLHLVPFINRPKRVNPDLAYLLEAEWPGILHWAVQGCLRWQHNGLPQPEVVATATADYFSGEDAFGRWLRERVMAQESVEVEVRDFFADWQMWCHEQNERPGTLRGFSQAMMLHGHTVEDVENGRSVIRAITLRRGEEFGATAGD